MPAQHMQAERAAKTVLATLLVLSRHLESCAALTSSGEHVHDQKMHIPRWMDILHEEKEAFTAGRRGACEVHNAQISSRPRTPLAR